MATLYVTQQGAVLRRERGRLLTQVRGSTRHETRLDRLERLVLLGQIQLTSGAVDALLERGIDVAYLTVHGQLKGRLVGVGSRNLPLRLAQYAASGDPERCLALARGMVEAKIRNSLRLVGRSRSEHGLPDLEAAQERLRQALKASREAASLDALRGQEGRAAAAWFRAFATMLRGELTFDRRRRRPPPDPVNALLSFGYGLVGAELVAVTSAVGFDPYLGFLHRPRYGRLSLAQDLLEEFRPGVVDRLVLKVVNRNQFGPEDFVTAEPNDDGPAAVRLTDAALRRFLEAYEKHVTREFQRDGRKVSLRRCFLLQAQALAKAVEQNEPYQGHKTN